MRLFICLVFVVVLFLASCTTATVDKMITLTTGFVRLAESGNVKGSASGRVDRLEGGVKHAIYASGASMEWDLTFKFDNDTEKE